MLRPVLFTIITAVSLLKATVYASNIEVYGKKYYNNCSCQDAGVNCIGVINDFRPRSWVISLVIFILYHDRGLIIKKPLK